MTWPLTALVAVAAVITAGWIALNRWQRWQRQLLMEGMALLAPAAGRGGSRDSALTDTRMGESQPRRVGAAQSQLDSGFPAVTDATRTLQSAVADLTAPSSSPVSPVNRSLPAVNGGASRARRYGRGVVSAAAALAAGAVMVIGERPALLAYVYLGAVLMPLVVCDLRLHRLPTCFIAPAYPVALAALTVDAAVTGEWSRLGAAALGCLILGGAYVVLCALPGGLMGLGDARLAGALGAVLAWVSWNTLLIGALGAFVLAFVAALPSLLRRHTRLQARVPFGPYMLASAALAIAAGT